MLTTLFLALMDLANSVFLAITPDTSAFDAPFEGLGDYVHTIVDFFRYVNWFIPLDTIISVIGIEVSIQAVMISFYASDKFRRVITSFFP